MATTNRLAGGTMRGSRIRAVLAMAAVAMITAGCSAGSAGQPVPSSSPPASSSGTGGLLVFSTQRDGHDVLETAAPTGENRSLLLPAGFRGDNPTFSHDGKRILFDSDQAATTGPQGSGFHIDLYVVSTSGGTPQRLTRRGINDKGAWSADGTRIAFERQDRDGAPDHISVMSADGSGVHDVTTNPFGFTDEDPSFSPDGTRIAFQRHRTGQQSALFVLTLGTDSLRQLTGWESQAGQIDWSPDGSRVLFNTGSDTGPPTSREIETINPDGTGLTRLAIGFEASWSPDGASIVFVVDGRLLTVMRADGTDQRVVPGVPPAADPDWG